MNFFISSLISGFEDKREAVKRAITVLGHKPVMAEGFGARSALLKLLASKVYANQML